MHEIRLWFEGNLRSGIITLDADQLMGVLWFEGNLRSGII